MKVFEIDNNRFVNFTKIFKFELVRMEDSEEVFWRFYHSDDSVANSKKFLSVNDARDWLDITLTRAASAEEIIYL